MNIVGLDLSLTKCGVCHEGGSESIKIDLPAKTLVDKVARMHAMVARVVTRLPDKTSVVVIESPAFQASGMVADLAGVWWMVVTELVKIGINVVEVAPTSRSTYAMGKADKKKGVVVAKDKESVFGMVKDVTAGMRDRFAIRNNDEADAFILYHMGLEHYTGEVLVNFPPSGKECLAKIHWPEIDLLSQFG